MLNHSNLPLVLILCTGNSCRSQMAEAFLRDAADGVLNVASAGSKPSGYVHPFPSRRWLRPGLTYRTANQSRSTNFSSARSKRSLRCVETRIKFARFFPGQLHRYHWAFEDPADATGSEEEQLAEFKRIRDAIKLVFYAYGLGRRDSMTCLT